MLSKSNAYPIHSLTSTSNECFCNVSLPSGAALDASARRSSSTFPCTMVITSPKPLCAALARATAAISAAPSTPTTFAAPPRAANMLRMPVPHPMSSTRFPLTQEGFCSSATRYAAVRATSSSITRWMSKYE